MGGLATPLANKAIPIHAAQGPWHLPGWKPEPKHLPYPTATCERGLGQRGDQTIFSSVAILTAGVARNPIHPAAAACTGVSWAPWAPARALGDPADLGVADSAADPVTAILLLHHDLALRAVHGLALL